MDFKYSKSIAYPMDYSIFAQKYFYSFVNAFLLFMNEATTRNLCIPHSFVTISVA